MYHIFFIHFSVNGHLGCFHVDDMNLCVGSPKEFMYKKLLELINKLSKITGFKSVYKNVPLS